VDLATGWLDSTILLIKRALSQAPPSRSSFRKLAMAEPCNDAPGWYLVQRRLSANELEFIPEGNLAHGSGGHAVAFDILEVAPDGEQVRVRVSGNAPRARLELCVRDTGPRQVLEGLARGLDASRANPLLTQFGERRLTVIRPDSRLADVHGWDSLRPGAAKGSRRLLLTGTPAGVGPAGDRQDAGHSRGRQPPGSLWTASSSGVQHQHRRGYGAS
jgi:hypothetical protein